MDTLYIVHRKYLSGYLLKFESWIFNNLLIFDEENMSVCTMYIVRRTLYTVRRTLYDVHCSMYTVDYSTYNK